jgi:hypothetical protein
VTIHVFPAGPSTNAATSPPTFVNAGPFVFSSARGSAVR